MDGKEKQLLTDPDLVRDGELSQYALAQRYGRGILQCQDIRLRDELLHIMTEEQLSQGELRQEQLKRGWVSEKSAPQEEILKVSRHCHEKIAQWG